MLPAQLVGYVYMHSVSG